ncbi:hypothetical protein [Thiohalospira sp.]|uniref:hypothetical protein n=1 Tax=Thiohalospira sp. TaxID=3080549 RepID=UPI0039805FC3
MRTLVVLLFAVVVTTGCLNTAPGSRGVYLVVDAEGVETAALKRLARRFILGLDAGDTFAVERIDAARPEGQSRLSVDLDGRPSVAVVERRALLRRVDRLLEDGSGPPVEGVEAVRRARTSLEATSCRNRIIVLATDLAAGDPEELGPHFDGYRFVALNVGDIGAGDEPWSYLRRVEAWRRAVEAREAEWAVANGMREATAEILER